jgi:FkbM family methyltransferase
MAEYRLSKNLNARIPMLISYKEIVEEYPLNFKNILHIGAHGAEEHDAYFDEGVEHVIWVEANPTLVADLNKNLDKEKNTVIESVVSDTDDEEVTFFITNNGQSSSILSLDLHRILFPDVHTVQELKVKTKTIKTVFVENDLNFGDIDFINLDIQGAELLALKGMGDEISQVKAIYTEINTASVYKNCALLEEMDSYLKEYGFTRTKTKLWENHPWGDALYINNKA